MFGRLGRYGIVDLLDLASDVDAAVTERARRYVRATVCDGAVGIRDVRVHRHAPAGGRAGGPAVTLVHIRYVVDRFTLDTSVDVDTFNRLTRA